MENVLTDTGLWYALFDARDQYHERANEKAEYLDMLHIILPWPILYETLRTRLVRNRESLRLFENFLSTLGITYLDDAEYRDAALRMSFDSSLNHFRPLSLVDCLIRLVLNDVNVRVDYFVTFNEGDFEDICRARSIKFL
jgi:predicted nucleic acid-binding protein